MVKIEVTDKEIEEKYSELKKFADNKGYPLNTDEDFTKALIRGLIINQKRYGYPSCPCRLATGNRKKDLDIICPCDYRDADLLEYGACFCALYVSKNRKEEVKVPERKELPKKEYTTGGLKMSKQNKMPVWRCQVCGYLCAKEDAPEICPICGATHDRFEKFE